LLQNTIHKLPERARREVAYHVSCIHTDTQHTHRSSSGRRGRHT
jgi:hypothetical protein